MPTWLKVVLVIFVVGLCLAAAGSFFAYRWFRENQPRLAGAGREAMAEGNAYGRGKEAAQCVDEAIRRLQSSGGFVAEMRTRVFIRGCLATATAPRSFCEAVPRQSEIIAAAEWTVNECRSRDAAELPRCSRVLQEVVSHCDRQSSATH